MCCEWESIIVSKEMHDKREYGTRELEEDYCYGGALGI